MSCWANKTHMTEKTLKRPLLHNPPALRHAIQQPPSLTRGELSLTERVDSELFKEIVSLLIQ